MTLDATIATLATRQLGVVLGLDEHLSSSAIRWATEEATLRRLPLTLVTTEPRSIPAVKTIAVEAPLAPTLIQLSAEAHVTVLDAAGRLGAVLRHAHSPVAVVPDRHRSRPHADVIVEVDGTPRSVPAIAAAFDAASHRGVDLVALHAWSEPGHLGLPAVGWSPIEWANVRIREQETAAERLAGFQEHYPDVGVARKVLSDNGVNALTRYARAAQLVVVGADRFGMTQAARIRRLATATGSPVLVTSA